MLDLMLHLCCVVILSNFILEFLLLIDFVASFCGG